MKFIYCVNVSEKGSFVVAEDVLPENEIICVGYKDFAGSGVVHIFAATCALVGCYFISPRIGRIMEDGQLAEIKGHSIPLTALGGFILMLGFLAFNAGSQVSKFNTNAFLSFLKASYYIIHLFDV